MARHFNHRQKSTVCSSQDPFAYNESLQHPTIAVLLMKISFFFLFSFFFFDYLVVFTCSKVINVNAFKR